MLHGLYDGGAGAALDDFWKLMLTQPLSAGGFIWVFADEGVVRPDKGGIVDVSGESAPDGIVGPFREKEASFYTCLLYTSDAADEEDSVDLGGRRIIKKKKTTSK